ncbi:hypothetical protein Q2T40_08210 [Winogradskyella maritima]|uniref:Peptidase M50B-like protein n=1 Tax=Winogradskyella maritima TaxID=1517766 RepID=A0ABV8AIG9_9FLAO|nr:hypothetical protein [Winogradskyella maritima]
MNPSKNIMNLKYIVICLLAVVLTFLLHEGAHYLTGTLLGYDMEMTLNSVSLAEGQSYSEPWHQQAVSIAGPVFTMLQAVVVYKLLSTSGSVLWYPFLFITALMRLMASVISYIGMPNDEARVSSWLGIGKMTLPVIVTLLLITLSIQASRQHLIPVKTNVFTFIILSIGITGLVYSNQYLST